MFLPFDSKLLVVLNLLWLVPITATTGTTATGTIAAAAAATTSKEYLEPDVRRYPKILPPEICRKIIALGEQAGFDLEEDSIDRNEVDANRNTYSQAIDVLDEERGVLHRGIFELLEPYIETVAKLIQKQRSAVLHERIFPDEPDRLPQLGWIFYRKYGPESARNALVAHTDSNLHTVNIALNDDFDGGGVFYVRPALKDNPEWNPSHPRFDNEKLDRGPDEDGIPVPKPYHQTYDWINTLVERKNTSEVVFPLLQEGDALVHNYTVWHAVAPLQKGVRYSMVLFFDTDNPLLNNNDDDDDDEDDDYYKRNDDNDDDFEITIRHQIRECDNDGKLVPMMTPVDVIWVSPDRWDVEQDFLKRKERVPPYTNVPDDDIVTRDFGFGNTDQHVTTPRQIFRAVHRQTREPLAEIRVRPEKTYYVMRGSSFTDCKKKNDDDDDNDSAAVAPEQHTEL